STAPFNLRFKASVCAFWFCGITFFKTLGIFAPLMRLNIFQPTKAQPIKNTIAACLLLEEKTSNDMIVLNNQKRNIHKSTFLKVILLPVFACVCSTLFICSNLYCCTMIAPVFGFFPLGCLGFFGFAPLPVPVWFPLASVGRFASL